MRKIKQTGRLYVVMAGVLLLLFMVAYVGTLVRTIGKESLVIGHETVMATVLDNNQITYTQGMTHTSILVENGQLLSISTVPGNSGWMIMRRNPTTSEEELWRKYFGLGVVPSHEVVLRAG